MYSDKIRTAMAVVLWHIHFREDIRDIPFLV